MECRVEGNTVHVTLSRKNLRTLLLKLDEPSSAKTLWRQQGGNLPDIVVRAEDDDKHYANREAGIMHPREEAKLKE